MTFWVDDWIDRFDGQQRRWAGGIAAWQELDVGGMLVANDHSDAEYDREVVARLRAVLARTAELVGELAAVVPAAGALASLVPVWAAPADDAVDVAAAITGASEGWLGFRVALEEVLGAHEKNSSVALALTNRSKRS